MLNDDVFDKTATGHNNGPLVSFRIVHFSALNQHKIIRTHT
jgi:hypothetical protein